MENGPAMNHIDYPMTGDGIDLPWAKHVRVVFVEKHQDRLAKLMEKYAEKPPVEPYFYNVPSNHVEMPAELEEKLQSLLKRLKIEKDLDYIKSVHVAHSGPETPSWDVLEPRIRNYLKHVYSKES